MARQRHAAAGMESVDELARKVAILEQELAVQQQAMDRLKEMGTGPKRPPESSRLSGNS